MKPTELEQEDKKQAALKRANDSYYDRDSPHYKDNERYRWAVSVISNKKSDK